jgi:hypothetical protein
MTKPRCAREELLGRAFSTQLLQAYSAAAGFNGSFRRTRSGTVPDSAWDAGKARFHLHAKGVMIFTGWCRGCADHDDTIGLDSDCSLEKEGPGRRRYITSLPVRTWRIFITLAVARADAQKKAMQSRCLGSMFAWILNLTVNFYLPVPLHRWPHGLAGGARSTTASSVIDNQP